MVVHRNFWSGKQLHPDPCSPSSTPLPTALPPEPRNLPPSAQGSQILGVLFCNEGQVAWEAWPSWELQPEEDSTGADPARAQRQELLPPLVPPFAEF